MARRDAPGPYNLEILRALPAPDVVTRDPAVLKARLVAWFEGETGRTLFPMQVETLLIDMCAYLWSLMATEAQMAHMQRYVTLADEAWLAHLGAQPGVETPRLDGESVDAHRLRLANALEKATICGQRMGYVEHAMALSSTIIDCGAVRPQPCYVDLYPLTAAGPASPALRVEMKAHIDALQRDEVLPMGDLVTVKVAEEVLLTLQLALVVNADDPAILKAARAAADAITAPWQAQLAPEIVPEAIRTAVKKVAGVVNVETPGFAFTRLQAGQYAVVDHLPPDVTVLS
jgi:hypothetical protein